MSTLTLELPDMADAEKAELLRMIAARLYERRTLSLSQAAKVANMPKWEFARILKNYSVPYFNYSEGELAEDVRNA